MKRIIFSLVAMVCMFLFVASTNCFSQQQNRDERITITTYYPSPYGIYRELRSQRMAVGQDYIDNTQYCWQGAPGCTNVTPNIIPEDYTLNPNLFNTDLIIEGAVRLGRIISSSTGQPIWPISLSPDYGSPLLFSGGKDYGLGSDNTDQLMIARFNRAIDTSELRVIVGDNATDTPDITKQDAFVVGARDYPGYLWYPRFTVLGGGNVGIGTSTPRSRLSVYNDTDQGVVDIGGASQPVSKAIYSGLYLDDSNMDDGANLWAIVHDNLPGDPLLHNALVIGRWSEANPSVLWEQAMTILPAPTNPVVGNRGPRVSIGLTDGTSVPLSYGVNPDNHPVKLDIGDNRGAQTEHDGYVAAEDVWLKRANGGAGAWASLAGGGILFTAQREASYPVGLLGPKTILQVQNVLITAGCDVLILYSMSYMCRNCGAVYRLKISGPGYNKQIDYPSVDGSGTGIGIPASIIYLASNLPSNGNGKYTFEIDLLAGNKCTEQISTCNLTLIGLKPPARY